jgi:hypothetical protein
MQDGRLLQDSGIRRGIRLIGPLARQGESAVVLSEQREYFVAANSADLESQKPFAQ